MEHTLGTVDELGGRVPETSSRSSESAKPRPLPAPVYALLQSSSSSELGDEPGCSSFERRCVINLAKSYLPVPPPPAPAQKITHRAHRYILHAHPGVILERAKRFGKGALEHYNRRKKSGRLYTHVNFTARSSKEGSKEQLFFAELYYCGKRRAPGGYLVTCCEPLGSDSTGFQVNGASVRKNVDFTRCFACGPRMLHPRGDKYIAGHCNVPHIYTNTC